VKVIFQTRPNRDYPKPRSSKRLPRKAIDRNPAHFSTQAVP